MIVVFDLDGTLLDTVDDLAAAVNHALDAINLPPRSREEVATYLGNGIRLLVERAIAGRVSAEQEEDAFSAFKTYYLEHCLDYTQPYEGIMELLTCLKEATVPTAIVSNKLDPAVKALNARFFADYVQVAIGEGAPLEQVEGGRVRRKPNPDALIAVMQQFGASPAETLYVGDSEVDIETARRAGLRCLSVTWGFRSEEQLIAAGAETLIHSPLEILDYLK